MEQTYQKQLPADNKSPDRHIWLNRNTVMLGVAMMVGMGIGSGIMMPLITLYVIGAFGVSFVVSATITSMRDALKRPWKLSRG